MDSYKNVFFFNLKIDNFIFLWENLFYYIFFLFGLEISIVWSIILGHAYWAMDENKRG